MEKVWGFIDSNFFQTIILIITVVVTVIIYFAQKREERKRAARAIIIQLDIINRRVDSLARILGSDVSKFDVDSFWQSEDIIVLNEWNKYSHMFIKKLRYNEIVALNNYYDNVVLIGKQQSEIKSSIATALKRGLENSTTSENGVIVPTLFFQTILRQYAKIVEERATLPYEQLKKIAEM